MSARRELHLNLNILNAGFYGSAWRAPESRPDAAFTAEHYVRNAIVAERGTFDAVFLADTPALKDNPRYRPYQALEPTILLSMMAAATEHIGLIATASTSYSDPYNIARRFGTLDLVSGGRVGINLVTTADAQAAWNFGAAEVPDHKQRYERAREYADVLMRLWDSWEDDAFVGDKASAAFVDVSRIHHIDHVGRHFSVKGPLTFPRSAQGRPVIVQAGGSEDGRDFAGSSAEVVFCVAQTLEEGVAQASDLRARARRAGRPDGSLLVLPGLATIVASTEAEARRRQQELWDLVPIAYSLGRLAYVLGLDPEDLDLDAPLPETLPIPANRNHTMFRATVDLAHRESLNVRQLVQRLGGGTGHRIVVGTPVQVADTIEEWFVAGAADGFNIMPAVLPSGIEDFVETVVPELRRRGLFRTHYQGRTLRDRLGLARPESRYAAGATPHAGWSAYGG